MALPHGLAVAVHLPGSSEAVPTEVLAALHPEERLLAEALHGFRQPEFVGGRLAFAALFQEMGARARPVLAGPRGEPVLPPGYVGSISHKKHLVVAMLARGGPGTGLGIDLEDVEPPREGIAERVLRPEERLAVEKLTDGRGWVDTVVRFAIKEAVYKALAPGLGRYIGFEEASAWPSPDGVDRVELHLTGGEGPFVIEARHAWMGPRVLASVRTRPA
jgi:4'-phosphopantetheinyl transferase EntD